MSGADMPPLPGDDDDLLAAEYALGLLDAEDWRAARDRAAVDGAFAARVAGWERRLAALNTEFAEAPVPVGQLARIEARLFPPTAAPARSRRGWWLAGLFAGGVAAAGLGVIVFQDRLLPPPTVLPVPGALTAALASDDGALRFAASFNPGTSTLTLLREAGPDPEAGRDFELWAIDDTGTPRSLGLVSGAHTQLVVDLSAGIVLAVSLEPAGGSPDPVPSGPVLAAAPLGET